MSNFKKFFLERWNETKPIRSVSKTYGIRLVLARVRLDFRLSLQKTLSLRGGRLIPTRRDRKRRYKFWPSYSPPPTNPPCRLPRIVAKSKKSSYIDGLSLGSRSSSVHKVLLRCFRSCRDDGSSANWTDSSYRDDWQNERINVLFFEILLRES